MRQPSVPLDTSPALFALQVERWRSMTLAERFSLIEHLNADVEMMAIAGIQAQHPGLSERELRL